MSEITRLFIKTPGTGYFLWHGYYYCMGIKNTISAFHTLHKYIQEVVAFMIWIGKGYLEPDIWPKTPEQAKSMESIMNIR